MNFKDGSLNYTLPPINLVTRGEFTIMKNNILKNY